MANKEHMLLLLRSIASGDCRVWNNWRIDHPAFLPQLAASELWQVNLSFINLSRSDLKLTSLSEANLYRANLEDSDLRMANLKNANLREANLQNSNLFHANLSGADLRHANLRSADLRQADLTGAILEGANLIDARFDPDTAAQLERLCEGCVSPLEKIALRLSKHRKSKRMPLVSDSARLSSSNKTP
jgi:uncharacterized protein YjbI with pentapeptide repeats